VSFPIAYVGLGSSRGFAYIFFPAKLKMFMLPLEPIEQQFYWNGWALRQSGRNNKFKKENHGRPRGNNQRKAAINHILVILIIIVIIMSYLCNSC